ncbi:MAG: hypothetical protein J6P45_04500, partial [Lachnospiraceae bacterium]|nr:hypothetical protein [Lachnospiraceae bacterium]
DVPDNILDITSLDGFTLIKKVSGRKSGTLKESDGAEGKTGDKKQLYDLTSGNFVGDYNKYVDKDSKNNEVVTGKIYMYVVIPKYDIKNTDVNYNFDKRSDTDLGMATLASVSVKNFTAANAGVNGYEGKIRVKWNKLKGADKGYVVYRTEVLPADPKTVDAWEALYKANQAKKYTYGQTDGATIAFTDTNVVTGEWYWYCIVATNGGQFDLSTSTKPVYKRAKAVPFAATSVKVEDNDNNIRQGARVTVAADSRNSNVRYYIEKRTNGGNWEYAGGYLTTSGTWTDNSELTRGDKRQYRVVSKVVDYSKGIQGGIREGGYYSKPKSISVKNMPATLALGETANVIVYPMLNENEVATYKRMESSYSGGIEIVSSKSEGDHMVFVIRARAKGKGIFTVWAKGCDWYPNTSRSNLQKSFSVTVK